MANCFGEFDRVMGLIDAQMFDGYDLEIERIKLTEALLFATSIRARSSIVRPSWPLPDIHANGIGRVLFEAFVLSGSSQLHSRQDHRPQVRQNLLDLMQRFRLWPIELGQQGCWMASKRQSRPADASGDTVQQ